MMSFRYVLFSFLMVLATDVFAQAVIRDSASAQQKSQENANETFVIQLQAMQEELQVLRGQLEKQAFEIKRLKQQRLDDYLDLDKRVSELATQEQVVNSEDKQDLGNTTNTAGDGISAVTKEINLAGNEQEAKALYDNAIDLLLSQQNYAAAEDKFQQYLTRYPKGRFIPNIYYWQGQISLANSKKEQAAKLFNQLIVDYPVHPKVPEAQFKLARIYFEDGKKTEAKTLLEKVAASDSEAALLAKSFLSKNYPD